MNEVISKMKDANEIENIEYREMDAFNMEGIPDKSIDVAFDKGMMDSLIDGDPWNPGPEVRRDTRNYQKEVGIPRIERYRPCLTEDSSFTEC
jgi:DNA modification methylase